MNFKDQWATDENGQRFIFTVEMQRRLFDAGLPVEPDAVSDLRRQNAPPAAPDPNRNRERRGRTQNVEGSRDIQIDPATGKYIGRLLTYDSRKRHGFISHGDDRLFFHQKQTLDDPQYMQNGQKVLYELGEYRGKSEARNVEEYEEPIE